MQQEAGIGQAEAVFLLRADKDQRAGARHPAAADGAHHRFDELDHVMHHVTGFDVTAGRRDEHVDRRVAFLGERHHVGDGALCKLVIDRARHDDRAALEKQPLDLRRFVLLFLGLFFLHENVHV